MILNDEMKKLVYFKGIDRLPTTGWKITLLSTEPEKVNLDKGVKGRHVIASAGIAIRITAFGFSACNEIELTYQGKYNRRWVRSAILERGNARLAVSAGRGKELLCTSPVLYRDEKIFIGTFNVAVQGN